MPPNKGKRMRIKVNRAASYTVIAFIYAFASAVGITAYILLDLEPWLRLLVADVLATVATFAFSVILKNASSQDIQ